MTSVLQNLLAYSSDGSVMVIAHEREVLVHSGRDESPLWRSTCNADVIAVGAADRFVYALDQRGEWSRWEAATGDSLRTLRTDSSARGMAVARNGDCAVFSSDAVTIIHDADVVQTMHMDACTAAAWSADGCLLACGDDSGRVFILQRRNQQEVFPRDSRSRTRLKHPVLSIAWSNERFWLASAGGKVWRIGESGKSLKPVVKKADAAPRLVAVSQTGDLLAVAAGDRHVLVFQMHPPGLVGRMAYPDRTVTGLAFGPAEFVGIGLDTGDGNKINLKSEHGVARTDPHPGRPQNRWMLEATILPPSQRIKLPATRAKWPGWTGPLVGLVIGLVAGLKTRRHVNPANPAEGILIVIGSTLAGLVVGLILWANDALQKK